MTAVRTPLGRDLAAPNRGSNASCAQTLPQVIAYASTSMPARASGVAPSCAVPVEATMVRRGRQRRAGGLQTTTSQEQMMCKGGHPPCREGDRLQSGVSARRMSAWHSGCLASRRCKPSQQRQCLGAWLNLSCPECRLTKRVAREHISDFREIHPRQAILPPPPSSPIAAKWATGAIAWRRFRRAKASGLPLPLPLPPFVFTLWARASPPRADSKGRPQRKTAPPSTRLGDKCGCDRSFVGRCALPPATTTRVHHDCAPLESRAPLSAGHRHGPDRGCPSVMLCHTCMPD